MGRAAEDGAAAGRASRGGTMSASAAPSAARPRLFQFTLASLLATMTWLGLVCVALARPTELWSAAMFLLTLVFFLGSVLVAVYRTGRTRAFALGFLVFGAGYLACLTLVAGSLAGALRNGWTPVAGASGWLFERLHPPTVVQQRGPGGPGGMSGGMGPGTPGMGMPGMGSADGGYGAMPGMPGGMSGSGGYAVSYTVAPPYDPQNFALICNLAMSCLAGVVGGMVAQWLYSTRRGEESAR